MLKKNKQSAYILRKKRVSTVEAIYGSSHISPAKTFHTHIQTHVSCKKMHESKGIKNEQKSSR